MKSPLKICVEMSGFSVDLAVVLSSSAELRFIWTLPETKIHQQFP
jgi:hypothetical protein